MGITLHKQQQEICDKIKQHWQVGFNNLLVVLPTGAGKTVIFAHLLSETQGVCCALAHRQELIVQTSVALAKEGVYHDIIPHSLIPSCTSEHMHTLGKQFYRPGASCFVTSVKSILRQADKLQSKLNRCVLMVTDEAHHVAKPNEWYQAAALFSNAKKLGFTATPLRSDGKGLGDHIDGIFQTIIEGPDLRWHIDNKYLCDYKIFAPLTQMNLTTDMIGATGDYSRPRLRMASRKSTIVGDVLTEYKKRANGLLGVTFATDIETAGNIVDNYNAGGVPAVLLQANTQAKERRRIFNRFVQRELLQIVNVDILGEGFDAPAIECVSFARPTASLGLYRQQFGRGLRIMEEKQRAIIIDHVGNVLRHGLPDDPIQWTLDRRENINTNKNNIMLKVCLACAQVMPRFLKVCPHCGYIPEITKRSSPELVDGDLSELTPEILEQLRNKVKKVDMSKDDYRAYLMNRFCPPQAIERNLRLHEEQQAVQIALRETMSVWGGYWISTGLSISEAQRKFYLTFGIDVLSAQSLKTADAITLERKVAGGMV